MTEITDLLQTDFRWGTVVEYAENAGFRQEHHRARITEVVTLTESLQLKLEGKVKHYNLHLSDFLVHQEGEVYYLLNHSKAYALAQQAVAIPEPAKRVELALREEINKRYYS